MHLLRLVYLSSCFILCLCNIFYAQTPKLVVPIGHTREVTAATFSPDGKKVLTVSADGTAKLWDAGSGTLLKDYKSGGDASAVNVTAASFSPGGNYVNINYEDRNLTIWETVSGKLVWDWNGTASDDNVPARFVHDHFSPDGKRIAMFSPYHGDTVTKATGPVIYDNKTQRPVFILRGHKASVTSLCYSADGKYIITASADNTVKTWNAANGKMISNSRFRTDSLQVLWTIPNSSSVMVTVKGVAVIIDILTGKQTMLETERSVLQDDFTFQVDGNGNFIAGLSGYYQSTDDDLKKAYEKITVWNARLGKQIYNRSGLAEYDDCVLFSQDGKKIILINADSTVSITDAATGKLLFRLDGFTNLVRKAAFTANNERIMTTLCDRSTLIWNGNTGKLNPALSNDTSVINASYDNDNILYDMTSKKKFFDMRQLKNFYQPRFSGNSSSIYADQRNRSVSIWNASDGKFITTIEQNEQIINDAVISDDGKLILIVSADHAAILFDINSGKYISEYKGRSIPVKNAWFSKDNSHLFILTDQGEKVLNTINGKLITDTTEIHHLQKVKFKPLTEKETGYHQMISPDGSLSLNWAPDIVQLTSLQGREEGMMNSNGLGPQNGRMDHVVRSVEFSPDSKLLLLTLEDNTTRIFDIKKDKFISTIILFDSTDYINQLWNGYYQVTPNAAKLLNYLTNDSKLISFEQLDVKYNRPDIVLRAMGNKDSLLIASYYNAYIKRIKKLGIDTTAFRDDYNIPEADLSNKDGIAAVQTNNKLTVHINGSDSKYLLDRFNCWINEVPLFGMKGIRIRNQNKFKLDTIITIILSEGDNRIETSVTNINGIESYRKPLLVKYVPEKAEDAKVYFIGVGINEFADSNYNLKWCVQDIRDMIRSMRLKYGDKLVIIDTLFNEKATRTNIRNLKRKLFYTGVNDKVIFSYSGHGLLSKDYDYYISSYTVNFSNPEEGGIPYDEIENMLDSIPARKKILFLDACNSGEVDKEEMNKIQSASAGLAKNSTTVNTSSRGVVVTSTSTEARVGLQNSFDLMQSLFVNVGKGTGTVIIAASGGVQFAQERSELGHGVFTYSVIEAMKKFPEIKISNLKKYIGNRVLELTNGLQKPTTRNETIAVDWNVW